MQRGSKQKESSKRKIAQSISEYWSDIRKYHPGRYRELCEKNKNNAKKQFENSE
jgi:hypothetical protein